MSDSPEERRRPKPGPGNTGPEPSDTECPICYLHDETATYESCGVIFSLLKAIATADVATVRDIQGALTMLDAHIATHIAYIFLYNICALTDNHPLDVIAENQDVIRESLAAG